MVRVDVFPYMWQEETAENEDTIIRIYGITRTGKSILTTVDNFCCYAYVELPVEIDWTVATVNLLATKIDSLRYGKTGITSKTFVTRKRLYYANLDKNGEKKEFPYLKLYFRSTKHRSNMSFALRKTLKVPGIGDVRLKMHEQDATSILQLTTDREISTASWISVSGKQKKGKDKESTCNYEIVSGWEGISPLEKNDDTMPEPRRMGFDIECNSSNPARMPDPEIYEDKVFQISCIVEGPGEYTKYLLSLGEPDPEKVGEDVETRCFKTEADLLIGFVDLIQEENPLLLFGYNILNFDIPFLIKRAEVNFVLDRFDQQGFLIGAHAEVKELKWTSSAYGEQKFNFLDVQGRLFVDLLPLVKRNYKLNKYTLKVVSEYFLGYTKDPLTPQGIFKCYRIGMRGGEKGANALAIVGKYCVKDTEVTNKLFNHLRIWVSLCANANTCHVPMFYLYTKGQQIKMYSQMYVNAHANNTVVEKDGYILQGDEEYMGAIVIDPIPGFYEDVVPFDFSSLYPTTIIAYNICFSTLVRDPNVPDEDCHIIEWDEHVNCKHDPEFKEKKSRKKEHDEEVKDDEDEGKPKKKVKKVCAHFRYRFTKKFVGLLPTMLKNLLSQRAGIKKEIKKLKKVLKALDPEYENHAEDVEQKSKREMLKKQLIVLDKLQQAVKVSANSAYGAMGVRRGYLPFLPGAMCTTAAGRGALVKASGYLKNKHEAQIVYGDTDSAMVKFTRCANAQELWDFCLVVEKDMEKLFPPPMALKFEEKIYKKFLIFTKKRYMALVCYRDGVIQPEIMKKGVLLARRDNSKMIRDYYTTLIMDVFNGKEKEELLNGLVDKINSLFQRENNDIKQFIITKKVGSIDSYAYIH